MNTTVLVRCRECAEIIEFDAPVEGMRRWRAGEFIQDAMPDLACDYRELLISGICPDCWAELFGEDEDEE